MVTASFGEGKAAWLRRLDWVLLVLGGCIAGLAYIQKFEASELQELGPRLRETLVWTSAEAWWLIMLLTLAGVVIKWIKQRLEANWIWSAVKAIIDRIAQDAFKQVQGQQPEHHHRATLFKHCRFKWWLTPTRHQFWPWGFQGGRRWPWSGWLIPVIRSGGKTQKTTTVFLAPDDADHVEGMAGYIWSMRKEGTGAAVGFPKALQGTCSYQEIQEYANTTRTSENWVRKQLEAHKVLSASFNGIPIEIKGKTWGVLVLDSRDPQAALSAPINMSHHAFVLGKLLERV